MSRPIVVTACMVQSSESGRPRRPWHLRAGGGAVHSIISGLMHCSKGASFDHLVGAGDGWSLWDQPAMKIGVMTAHDLVRDAISRGGGTFGGRRTAHQASMGYKETSFA